MAAYDDLVEDVHLAPTQGTGHEVQAERYRRVEVTSVKRS